jgi:NodT family efflux transporter outer membrane factor (OMF) lipoprotein
MPRGLWPATSGTLAAALLAGSLAASGCIVGPKYVKPDVPIPPAFKELPQPAEGGGAAWKVAEPADEVLRERWWELFGDPQLNALEDQIDTSNQNVAAAMAGFLSARAVARQARSHLFPTVSTNPAISVSHQPSVTSLVSSSAGSASSSTGTVLSSGTYTEFLLPFSASWEADVWGRLRNTVQVGVSGAQASAADLENVRLIVRAELAMDYYELRAQDRLQQLFDETVSAYQDSLDITRVQFQAGIASDEAVAQAETQLEATQAQATNLGIARAQFEHAIALLLGQPASTFSLAASPLNATVPAIPASVPSALVERRPDVAAAERRAAQANAQIGVAQAAFFPTVMLTGAGGFASTSIVDWLQWPSRFWSVGPALAQTIFDAGLRRETVKQYQASFEQTVATYRETVLTAFQQVEDNLATLRILSQEIEQQDAAVMSATRSLTVATARYRAGIDPYLNVIAAQTTLLANQQTAVNLRRQQMTASVQLIEALGGGWTSAQLPPAMQILSDGTR